MSVNTLIRNVQSLLRGHVSDEELTLLLNNELPFAKRPYAERHLGVCAKCRVRKAAFEDAVSQVIAYRDLCTGSDSPAQYRRRRERLVEELERLSMSAAGVEERSRKSGLSAWALPHLNRVGATAAVFAVASVVAVLVWLQQLRPTITPSALLVRAEVWDTAPRAQAPTGVARQVVRITTSKHIVKRTIYRDLESKRAPRPQQGSDEEGLLRGTLAVANVGWDAPLSATTFQDWHDRLRVREDRIRRSAGDLLVLTTTTSDGIIAAQSLTVRGTDFHPVSRTVAFRDKETVEIAELEYAVLPWNSASDSLFEPVVQPELNDPMLRRSTAVLPQRTLPSEVQLDEAELSVRMTLDRLHADTGEQIEVVRTSRGVDVQGVTETKDRKRELEAELITIPYVTTSLASIEESQAGQLSSEKAIEVQTRETPLEAYYRAHGRSVVPLGELSQRLLNRAFAVNLESKAIDDLQGRFSRSDGLSLVASATLANLLFTHKQKLLAALQDEEQVLVEAQIQISRSDAGVDGSGPPLTVLSERNLALARELALGGGRERPAESIVLELTAFRDELDRKAHETEVVPRNSASAGATQ